MKRALIIDDEPDVTTYLATVLGDAGWQVDTANAAADGLALAHEHPPDIVLLDVMMPERGGMSTLVAFRKDPLLKGVPVVLVTGIQQSLTEDFEAYLKRFKYYHPDAYVEKPIEPQKLLELLEKLTSAAVT